MLTVGTLSDAPPSICINSQGQFTGFDNELLRAIADKLGLQVNFVGTEFSGLLAQGQRIGVVQGAVQEAYVVDTLHLDPVKFIVMWTRRAEVDPVAGVVGWSGAGAAGQTGWRSRFGGACRRGWLASAACVSVPTTPSRRR